MSLTHAGPAVGTARVCSALLRVPAETVKWHMKNVFEKLNVNSRFEGVQSAFGIQPGAD